MATRTATVIYVGDDAQLERTNARVKAGTAQVEAAASKAGASIARMGRDFAAGLAAAAVASVDLAVKQEQAAAKIAAASGTGAAAAKKVVDAFRGMAEGESSARKVGEAYGTVAGELKAVEGHALGAHAALKVMNAAEQLQLATGGKLVPTTEALGKVMFTYGLRAGQAAQASDILFNASKATGTGVESLAQIVDRMHGRLGVLAPSLQETTGLMVDLAKQGVAGRQSLSALNGVFSTLIGGGKKVEAVTKELGLKVTDSTGKFVGLKSVISQLQPELAKYDQASQLAATKVLFGAGANKQLLDIIHQGPAAFEAATAAVSKHGTAAAAAAKQSDTFEGKVQKLRAAAENFGEQLGEKVIPAITATVEWMKRNETAVEALAGVITVALGGAVGAFVATKAAAFVSAVETMGAAGMALAARMVATASGVDAAVAEIVFGTDAAAVNVSAALMGTGIGVAVVALGIAAVELSKHWKEAMGTLEEAAQGAANFVIDRLNDIIDGINELTSKLTLGLVPAIEKIKHLSGAGQGGGGESEPAPTAGYKSFGSKKELSTAGGIMGFFEARGLSPAQAAGIVGNFRQESSLNSETNTKEGIGFASWLGSRRTAEEAFAKGRHESVLSPTAQLNFAWHELQTSHNSALVALRKTTSPQEAARVFEKLFEGASDPRMSQREEYAAMALGTHHQSQRHVEELRGGHEKESSGGSGYKYGAGHLPSPESLTEKAKKPAKLFTPHGGTTGFFEAKGTDYTYGKEEEIAARLDKLAKAMKISLTGISGYRTAAHSIAVGGFADDPHTRGEASDTEGAQKIAESLLKKFGLTRPFPGAKEEDHIQLLPGVKPLKAAAGELGTAAHEIEVKAKEAAKRAMHLILTPLQKLTVDIQSAQTSMARFEVGAYSAKAGYQQESLSRTQARMAALKPKLGTTAGDKAIFGVDELTVKTKEAEKLYYEKEVKALAKEVKGWEGLRNSYLKFGRHATGPAKKQAIKKAAEYLAKIQVAQGEAKELHGAIATTENEIIESNAAIAALPAEIAAAQAEAQGTDLSAYQSANAKVDAEVRAGVITEQQGKEAKEANARKAEAGGYGALSEEGLLQVKGDLKEFSEATTAATDALKAHTEALEASAKALSEFAHVADAIGLVEADSLSKSLADTMNGQIGGIASGRRVATVGSGSAASY